MTGFADLLLPDKGEPATPIRLVAPGALDAWLEAQPPAIRAQAAAQRFAAAKGEIAVLSGDDGTSYALAAAESLGVWDLSGLAARLPAGRYRVEGVSPGAAALGWLLAQYRFDRYKSDAEPRPERVLLTPEAADIPEAIRLATATALVRDLVNTPASDMGPADLQHAAEALAKTHGATLHITKGHDLETGYPMIHAVGMAAEKARAPRLIELEWGRPDHPRVAVIGKGVCFDSGGLDIKPGSGMRLMKKDMGGAAHALALAGLIMEARLPVRLHMLIPAVENAISGNAFRPGDILKSRKGLSVEIDNTDAEGRLILADALTKAAENEPGLIVDFATLTGAARVALGPDLPALFANDHGLAGEINQASVDVHDPVWRLPLWSGYDEMLKSEVADLSNSAEGGMAGSITAALFLRRFVAAETPWAHLDTFAWRPSAKPGRPKGGDALGLRAVYEVLKRRYPSV